MIHSATKTNCLTIVLSIWLAGNKDINIRDSFGNTVFHHIPISSKSDAGRQDTKPLIFDLLLALGGDPSIANNSGSRLIDRIPENQPFQATHKLIKEFCKLKESLRQEQPIQSRQVPPAIISGSEASAMGDASNSVSK